MFKYIKNIKITKKRLIWLSVVVLLLVLYTFSLPRRLFDDPRSSVILSRGGELLGARIAADGQWRFPQGDTVPYKFAKCIVAFEDKRFYHHIGIDPLSVGRAVRDNLSGRRIVSGASTLTMQVIRLSRKNSSRHIGEKILEAILATRLELTHTKAEILNLYASNAPFGGNVVGIEAAAWRYFGRPANNLSWAEAATLAVLPNSPALIHFGRNRSKLEAKRNFLLRKLHDQKIIDAQTLELALEEDLPDRPVPLPMYAPHLLDRVARERPEKVVRTNIDYNLQRVVSELAKNYANAYRANRVENIAIFVSEVRTGRVVSYVGNIYADSVQGTNVDIITSRRSSGSTLKPILYASMLDAGDILPGTLIPDIPFRNRSFSPNNFNRTFDGAVPAHRVLERSLNVPTVRMLKDYGTENFHIMLRKLGFTTINRPPDHYGLTLVLGGAEITLWDLCKAYSSMAQRLEGAKPLLNPSIYADIKYVQRENFPISSGALWLTLETLQNVNRPEEEQGWQKFEAPRRVAWKTGTSYGNRDAWSIGVTPEYVVGVWVGNASGEGRPLLTGVGYAAPVMFDVFNVLPRTDWFSRPEIDMRKVEVCAKSGFLASPICPERDSIWVPTRGIETPLCPYHIEVNLSRDGKYRVNSDCEDVSKMIHATWFVLPPAQEWYYRQNNLDYRPLPPFHPNYSGSGNYISPMEVIYPTQGMEIIPTRGLDGEDQGVIFHAVHNDPSAQIYWHVDDEFIGTTSSPEHKIKWQGYAPGVHTLTLVESGGASLSIRFRAEAASEKR